MYLGVVVRYSALTAQTKLAINQSCTRIYLLSISCNAPLRWVLRSDIDNVKTETYLGQTGYKRPGYKAGTVIRLFLVYVLQNVRRFLRYPPITL